MTRSFYSSVIGAAVLLAAGAFTQVSHAQDSGWNHGFGPRNYGYSGTAYPQSYARSSGYGYNNSYVTGYSPYYGVNPLYGVYPSYTYSGVGLGVYPNGFYSYTATPYYGAYFPAYGNYAPYGNYGLNSRAAAVRANEIRNQNIRNAKKGRLQAW